MSRDKVSHNAKISEDAPTNSVGSGNIAGAGVGPQGEPGVSKKKQARNKSPVLFPMMMRKTVPNLVAEDMETFAGAVVFEVSSQLFHNLTLAKSKGRHWRTYLEEDDCYAEIREWANRNKGPIIVRNENTGEMRYVRYRR